MPSLVTLIGIDFGTTTASAVVASASLVRSAATGRVEISGVEERYRSEIVFTPFAGDDIDLDRSRALLDRWMTEAGVQGEEIFGGGAILTGLCARRRNAAELATIIRERVSDAVMAVADDPCLEAWMAFMGSAAGVSRARPGTPVLNMDIGGGTTSLALGLGGEVIRTGSLLVGARHVALTPDERRITALSEQGRSLLAHLGVRKGPGDVLAKAEAAAVVDFYVDLLEGALEGRSEVFEAPIAAKHVEVPLTLPEDGREVVMTFSGGVGELIYAGLRGEPLPPPGHHGDLGVDLARRILRSARLLANVAVPSGMGRATSYGLLRHATQLSGATLFLPRPEILPLQDLPIVARLAPAPSGEDVRRAVDLVGRSSRGGCIEVRLGDPGARAVQTLGRELAGALQSCAIARGRPVVVLLEENAGKALGGYATAWGKLDVDLLVIDEVSSRGAHFVRIGRMREQVVPISFHGMT